MHYTRYGNGLMRTRKRGRMSKRKITQKDLFMQILDEWRDDEKMLISEFCIKDKRKAYLELEYKYEEYKQLWDKLKEQTNG